MGSHEPEADQRAGQCEDASYGSAVRSVRTRSRPKWFTQAWNQSAAHRYTPIPLPYSARRRASTGWMPHRRSSSLCGSLSNARSPSSSRGRRRGRPGLPRTGGASAAAVRPEGLQSIVGWSCSSLWNMLCSAGVRRVFPGRSLLFVGDSDSGTHAVARFCRQHCARLTLVSKLQPDANLFAPPPRYWGTVRPPGPVCCSGGRLFPDGRSERARKE